MISFGEATLVPVKEIYRQSTVIFAENASAFVSHEIMYLLMEVTRPVRKERGLQRKIPCERS